MQVRRDSGTVLHLDFLLQRAPDVQAAFDRLLVNQQTVGNPRYHQWLTSQQIGQFYGPAQGDIDALTGWLAAQGFHVDEVTPGRTFVRVSAPVAVVAQALSTSFRMFNVTGAIGLAPTPHISAVNEPAIPTVFTSLVQGIAGLSDVPDEPMSRMSPAHDEAPPQASGIKPAYTSSPTVHFLAPGDFAVIYDVPSQATSATDGTGQKVAIIGRSQVLPGDVTNFQAAVGLPAKLPNLIIPPGTSDPGLPYSGDQSEATLDVQRVAGSAPGAQIDLIVATNASGGIRAAIQYNVQTLMDPVMNISFGACEANAGLANVNLYANLFSQAAAEGISVFVSSADSGVATCDAQFSPAPATQFANINYICSSGFTTCVGATEFNDTASPSTYWNGVNAANRSSALSYIPEGAWNEPTTMSNGATSYVVAAGGGGVSMYTAKPSFQSGVGVPADGFRDVPDVSFSGAGHDGYFGCYAGPTGTFGSCITSASGGLPFVYFSGTSAAAPGMASVAALLNQKSGTPQGNLNPLIYKLAANTTAGAFHDATIASSGVTNCTAAIPSMCNNSTPSTNALTGGQPGYLLTTGFDLATGWGSLDVGKFLAASVTAAAPTKTTLTGSQGTIPPNTALSFTIAVTPVKTTTAVPTGTVQLYLNGTVFGATATVNAAGTATMTATNNLPLGSNLVSAVYSGDGTFGSSTAVPLTLNITAGSGVTTTVAAVTPNPGTSTQSLTLTANVTAQSGNAPNGTVTFSYQYGALSTVPVVKGVATLPGYTFSPAVYTFSATYNGDGANASSVSPNVTETVNVGPSTTIVTGTTSVLPGAAIPLQVTVTGSPFPSTGTVKLNDGTNQIGMATLTKSAGTSASITFFTPSLTAGTHSFTAVYGGDTYALGSTSAPLVVVVGSNITLTPATPTLTFGAGSATGNSDVLTLSSPGGFTGPVTLACTVAFTGSGTPTAAPTCSLSNTSITLAAGGSGTTTLTIATIAPHSRQGEPIAELRGGSVRGLLTLALVVGLLPIAGRRRPGRRLNLLLTLFAGILLGGAVGCGGSSGQSSPPTPLSGGTTAGGYTLTVNAAGTLSGTAVTTATTINLTIQ